MNQMRKRKKKNEVIDKYKFNNNSDYDNDNQVKKSINYNSYSICKSDFEINAICKEWNILDFLNMFPNGKIKIEQQGGNQTVIEMVIFIDKEKRNKMEFKIVIVEGRDYFDYIPIEINFQLDDKEDEILYNDLEIPIEDMGKLMCKLFSFQKK